ncbi:MAG: membrane protein insertase YidC [Nitrospiraceae bacterium]|nr:membrane protein insertase YidC [Nitrospiraceae bacterium]
MENKTLLAIALSMFVLIGFQFLVAKQQPPVQPAKPGATAPAPKKEEAAKTAAPAAVEVPPQTAPAEEKEIRVENSLFSAVLSSRGGTVKFWELKKYKDQKGKDVVLLPKTGPLPALGIGADTTFDLSRANFTVVGNDLTLDGSNKSGTIVFEYAKDGVSVRRTYTFYADTYSFDLADQVSGMPSYWITLGSDFGAFEKEAGYAHLGPALLKGTSLEELKPKKLTEPKTFKDDLKWIAQEDKYFCSAIVPAAIGEVLEARAWLYEGSPVIAFQGKPGENKFHIYAGPKENDRLEKLGFGLQYIIDFGFFSIIARPLFWILKFFYASIGNYGWSIILLTIVVRTPFIPLLNKGQRSMRKLQELQPKMNEIKEKYKKDPQKMQAEMMELYKKYKVNPMGGCLPMLVQIPFFFALYKVLLVSIELRGAPWLLWITDLSAPDTLFGHLAGFSLGGPLPYLMGITMLIQQKMTPTSADPKQAKMMMLMPIVFTFMFLNFASGLVLYWLVNNLLSIIQQFFVNKKLAKQSA